MSLDLDYDAPLMARARRRRAIDRRCERLAGPPLIGLVLYGVLGLVLSVMADIDLPKLGAVPSLIAACVLLALGTPTLLLISPIVLASLYPYWSWIEPGWLRYGLVSVAVLIPSTYLARLLWADTGLVRARIDGEAAEQHVSEIIQAPWLRERGYTALESVLLVGHHRGREWSREIDHLLVGPAGVIVIETKSRRGRIDGSPTEPDWQQTNPGGAVSTMRNPMLQLQGHVRVIERLIGAPPAPIHSLCVVDQATISRSLRSCVTPVSALSDRLRRLMDSTGEQIDQHRIGEILALLRQSHATRPEQWAAHIDRAQAKALNAAARRPRHRGA